MIDNLEYNSTREKLIISEYGRNIQKLAEYCVTIEDREERLAMATHIVGIMTEMSQITKDNSGEHNHKLWDHLHIITDWKLDIDGPYPAPEKTIRKSAPEQLSYNDHKIGIRHYGGNLALLIDKACELEESPEKEATVLAIANQMKKSYLKWNRDSVNDRLILNQLDILSDGKLSLPESTILMTVIPEKEEVIVKKKKGKPKKKR